MISSDWQCPVEFDTEAAEFESQLTTGRKSLFHAELGSLGKEIGGSKLEQLVGSNRCYPEKNTNMARVRVLGRLNS